VVVSIARRSKRECVGMVSSQKHKQYFVMCKEWNALLSSTKFITNDWAATPPNNKPWLVLHYPGIPLTCMDYCFFTNTWKRFPLAFLEEKYRVSAETALCTMCAMYPSGLKEGPMVNRVLLEN
jgi:hypothetical protein